MWAYLALAPTLQSIQIQEFVFPGANPPGVSGNIVVESGELVISSLMEMLPGSTIRVKTGAKLRVASTITAACGQMWQGIIVEGDAFDPNQAPADQGQVDVVNGGIIEHAHCGIDVQDLYSPDGGIGTGGGIIRHWMNAQLKNNIIGVRFGQYTYQNHSNFNGPIFSVTDDYRGGNERPILLELNAIKGLNVRLGRFWDLRTQCPDPASRAIGIDSWNAGFRVSLSSHFENLYRGVRADKLTETNGSLSVSASNFIGCYKEIELTSSGSFFISGNDFLVKKPDTCSSLATEVKGVEIRGKTTGFTFSENDFSFDGEEAPAEALIGTDCVALGEGMGNTIFKNTYSNMTIGNRASGDNGFDSDGLLYLCNRNGNIQTSFAVDFLIASGSIRQVQGQLIPGQPTLPTGNIFSGDDPTQICTIINNGAPINYHFYDGDPAQNPGTPGDPNNACDIGGFIRNEVSQSNENCDEPGFLSEVILWRNGIEQSPDCSGDGNKLASTSSASSEKKAMLTIDPNPANDILYVEHPSTGQNGWLRIFDLQGRLQKEIALPATHDKISIPIGDFNNGLYLIHWLCNGVSGYKKVVIAH